MESEKKTPESKDKTNLSKSELISFAFDLGFSIAIPLIIFAFGGRWLDVRLSTAPIFLIIGLLISLITTGIIVHRKIKKMM